MASKLPDDPFFWDEKRVVEEFCTSNRSWPSSLARKLPDNSHLTTKLTEYGLDGHSLLTYEDLAGPQGLKDLLQNDLGIKLVPQRLSVMAVIQFLKSNSLGYRMWKKDQAGDAEEVVSEAQDAGLLTAPPSESTLALVATPVPSVPDEHEQTEAPVSEEPPRKKRRTAVTTILDAPVQAAFAEIPTEADVISIQPQRDMNSKDDLALGSPEHLLRSPSPQPGYLGNKIIIPRKITEQSSANQEPTYEFQSIQTSLPVGRQFQVNRAMKRYLGRTLPWDDAADSDDDELLPAYDPEEEMDSDTWREIEQDEEEALQPKQIQETKKRSLAEVDVRAVLDRIIRDVEARWDDEKKPKHDRKALDIWNQARRSGSRATDLRVATAAGAALNQRLVKLVNGICDVEWFNKQDIERQAISLEPTVEDRCHNRWLIELLKRPVPPPPRSSLPKRQHSRIKEQPVQFEDDEEFIESDSETNSFIEDDDEPEKRPAAFLDDVDEQGIDDPMQTNFEGEGEGGEDGMLTDDEETFGNLPQAHDAIASPQSAIRQGLLTNPRMKSRLRGSQYEAEPSTPSQRREGTASQPIELQATPTAAFDLEDRPGFNEPGKIGLVPPEEWARRNDPQRLVIAVLESWRTKRGPLLQAVATYPSELVWEKLIMRILEPKDTEDFEPDTEEALRNAVAFNVAKLFDAFICCTAGRVDRTNRFRQQTIDRLKKRHAEFDGFCEFLRSIQPHFESQFSQSGFISLKRQSTTEDAGYSSIQASDDEVLANKQQYDSSSTDVPRGSGRRKKAQRPVMQDMAAASMRVSILEQKREFDERRKQLRQRIEQSSASGDKSKARLIINESASTDQALIYINDNIGGRIKDHQIEGVRFMWNQIVASSENRQGCLLAHTMGLGKTMQVVTLLVAIAEASSSPNLSIRSQIPEDLRETKVLVLCPAGLVNNWIDEFLIWAPEHVLGELRKIDANMDSWTRHEVVDRWNSEGGILLMGYPLFAKLSESEGMRPVLDAAPNIVVCDEAHVLKNPNSNIHKATDNFRTMSRIAMTGSPLTNNVMDYYAMINWVAPGYLADLTEFNRCYATPIKEGLYADSARHEKRRALQRLSALRTTVAPKVHRMGISALVGQLPAKREFIISVPLTSIQRKAYETYVEYVMHSPKRSVSAQARVWSFVSILSTLLAHPRVFLKQLQTRKKDREKKGRQPKDDDANEEDGEIPDDLRHQMLALITDRNTGEYELSNKIVVLLRILDEAAKCGDKVLIFSQSVCTLDYLQWILEKKKRVVFRLDGKTPVASRQGDVKRFNSIMTSAIYLISTKAGGVGLNINGANRVVIFDFKYTPAEEQQAIGRVYRIGQEKPVFIYWLICGGTFESTIQNKSVFKMQLASRVVDKKNPIAWSSRLGEYFAKPTDPQQKDLSCWAAKDRVLDALLDSDSDGIIREITSTDTFEEEDTVELSQLTENDEIEVKDLLEQEQRRQQWKGQPGSFVYQLSYGTLGQVPGSTGTEATSPCKKSESSSITRPLMIRLTVPPHLQDTRPSYPPLPNPYASLNPLARPSLPGGLVPAEPGRSEPLPTQIQSPLAPSATEIRLHQQQRPTSSGVNRTSFPPPNSSLNELETQLKRELSKVHNLLQRQKRAATLSWSSVVEQVNQALDARDVQGLPRKDHIQILTKTISKHSKFGEAILLGYYDARQVAGMNRKQILEAADALSKIDLAEYKSKVSDLAARSSQQRKQTKIIPQAVTNTRSESRARPTANSIAGSTPRPHASPSIKRERQDRLPKWAFEGVLNSRLCQTPQTRPERANEPRRPGDSAASPHVID